MQSDGCFHARTAVADSRLPSSIPVAVFVNDSDCCNGAAPEGRVFEDKGNVVFAWPTSYNSWLTRGNHGE